MRRILFGVAVLAVTIVAGAPIEPLLLERMSTTSKNEYLPVVIALREQFNGEEIIRTIKVKDERWRVTVSGLKELAARTQQGLLQELTRLEREGKARNITPLWIVNAVYCELVSEAILKVAERADVWFVQWD